MRADFTSEGRGTPSALVRSWLATLLEPSPPAVGELPAAAGPSAHRLSRSGQITLGLAMTLLAFLLYGQTLAANQQLSQRFEFCPSLPRAETQRREGVQQAQSLINNLASATPGQKLRLRQQSQLLLVESARLCGLASLYRSQEVALMTVATVGLCLLSLSVALGVSHGLVNNTNRTLQTLQVTSALLLAVPMAFLQLGEQMRNTSLYQQLYLARLNLHEQMLSTLANQNLPVWSANPCGANRTALSVVPGLTDATRVAELIRRVDGQLQALPPIPLNLNDATEKHVFGLLTNGPEEISK
jgi:hypothetical protein